MEQREQETLLLTAARVLKFATDHPYAATGIFGAAVGSAVTYRVLTHPSMQQTRGKVFGPKVYEMVLPAEDLRRLLNDPAYELRWETPETAVIVTAEKKEPLKALPDIEINDVEEE